MLRVVSGAFQLCHVFHYGKYQLLPHIMYNHYCLDYVLLSCFHSIIYF